MTNWRQILSWGEELPTIQRGSRIRLIASDQWLGIIGAGRLSSHRGIEGTVTTIRSIGSWPTQIQANKGFQGYVFVRFDNRGEDEFLRRPYFFPYSHWKQYLELISE